MRHNILLTISSENYVDLLHTYIIGDQRHSEKQKTARSGIYEEVLITKKLDSC